jgi:hypothetical protein
VRHGEPGRGQLAQPVDHVADPRAVLAEVEVEQHRLLDLVVVAADRLAVPLQHVELVRHLGGREQVAGVRVLRDQQQRLLLSPAADEDGRAAHRQRRVEQPVEAVVLPHVRGLVAGEHLPADEQRLLQPLEPLGGRREQQAQAARLVGVPGRADAQHGPAAGEHVEGGHRLGQQTRFPVRDAGDQGEQLGPSGVRGEEAEGRVRLQHVVLGWADDPDLPEVVHHADPVEARLVGRRGHVGEHGTDPRGAVGPGEVRDVQAKFHVRNPTRTVVAYLLCTLRDCGTASGSVPAAERPPPFR